MRLRCLFVNFIWISDSEFYSFRESTKGYLDIETTQWCQEFVGSSGFSVRLRNPRWGALGIGHVLSRVLKTAGSSPDASFSVLGYNVWKLFSSFFQNILSKGTGIWDKESHWKDIQSQEVSELTLHALYDVLKYGVWLTCVRCYLLPASNHFQGDQENFSPSFKNSWGVKML